MSRSGALELRPHVFLGPGKLAAPGELGRLAVPVRHAAGTGGTTIEIGVGRLPARISSPGDPIVVLAGGPGGSAVASAGPNLSRLLDLSEVADVLLLDQRGVGLASPNLTSAGRFDLPLGEPGSRESLIGEARRLGEQAATFWAGRGVDLGGFTTVESANDVDALRRALGVERLSLVGGSYGSHLALAVVKLHPGTVGRIALTGVEGPDDTIKLPSAVEGHFRKVRALAAADRRVGRLVPNLLAFMYDVRDGLSKEPVTATVPDPEAGSEVELAVGVFDLQRWTTEAAGSPVAIRALPASYLRLADGDWGQVASHALAHRRRRLGNAMSWVMDAASGASSSRLTRIVAEAAETFCADAIDLPHPHVGDAWGAPDLGAEFRAPVVSDVEALLVSGDLDGRTPPSNAESVAAGMPNASHVVVEGMSHGGPVPEEITRAIVGFLRDGARPPEGTGFGQPLEFDVS